ncbi:serine acetyltransferase [[Clostridium] ultunense Esp]|uniref:serine O-acetyltransferase n=1 Tax=Thermicanus aegyptius TaxID=94009 RepID=UPI0002B70DB0|nr:serine O-acetyltransferase [Thermicanus aegyptius]CCQ93776.1 serine acetyltransferase [[Clostridium] ultunense Esp]
MLRRIREDIEAVLDRDPAARNWLEVILTYPGLHALWGYRIAHWLWNHKLRLVARLLSLWMRWFTGIEIHPAAVIGRKCFIDHGMGVVIGETCEIGDSVTIYQGVTLGGTGKETGKRHPTIGNHVLIATGAKVLGSIKVGDYVKIGAGSVVLKDVPPHSTVVGIPGRIVIQNGRRVKDDFNQINLPDPIAEDCDDLRKELQLLRKELEELRREMKGVLKHDITNL